MAAPGKTAKKTKNNLISGIYETFLGSESALRRYIARMVYRPEDIDDMVQETFLRAYHATHSREIDYPKAYLFRVAKSVAMRELTKKANQLTDYVEEAQLEAAADENNLEQELEAQQKIRFYCEAIAELPPQCRRVFLMRKYQAMSHKQIAAALGITVGAVEKQVTLGIKRTMLYINNREDSLDNPNSKPKPKANQPWTTGRHHD